MDEEQIHETQGAVGRADPEFERTWAKAVLEQQQAQEKALQSAWRMWKFVRNDQQMTQIQKQLDETRSCIRYLEDLIRELEHPTPAA